MATLGKQYAIPLRPKADHELFRDISDDTDATGNPHQTALQAQIERERLELERARKEALEYEQQI